MEISLILFNFLEEWNERNLRRVGREDSGVQPFGLGRFGTNLDRRRVTHNVMFATRICQIDLDVCIFAVNIHREFSIDVHMGVRSGYMHH